MDKKKKAVVISAAVLLVAGLGFFGLRMLRKPEQPSQDEVVYVSFNADSYTVFVGKQTDTAVQVLPDDAADKSVVYESADPAIATVDKNGTVTGVAYGSTTITATASNGVKGTVKVNVKTEATGISFDAQEYTVYVGKQVNTTVKILPEESENKKVTYESTDSVVAAIDSNGVITGIKCGTVTITATAANGIKATATVTVKSEVSKVSFTADYYDVCIGKQVSTSYNVYPAEADDKKVTYSTADSSIATVDANGIITGVSYGTTTITAKSANGVTGTVKVNVKAVVTSISFDSQSYSVSTGKKVSTAVTALPEVAEDKSVTYETGDSSVAIVDINGVVTGISKGKTTVTATSVNGVAATAEVNVTETTWISMPQEYYSWNMGSDGKSSEGWICKPVLDPDVADWTLTFSSDDDAVARVDKNGNIVCCSLGSATITATVSDGSTSFSASMPVYVNGYYLNVTSVDYSHEGAGFSKVPTFYYGCTCESNGKQNVVRYSGSIIKYYNGEVTKYDIGGINSPTLTVEDGSSYFQSYDNGFVRIRSAVDSITESKTVYVSFTVDNDEGLNTLGDKAGFNCVIEPNDFTASSGGDNVYSFSYTSQSEADVYVAFNNKITSVNFNRNVADVYLSVPSCTDEISSVSCSGTKAVFTPAKASSAALETDVVAYSAGGQKVYLHVYLAEIGSPVTFVKGEGVTFSYGGSFSLAPTIDSAKADFYGGVTVSYSSDNPDVAKIDSNGKVSYVTGGQTTVTVTAKYGGKTETKKYTVCCNGYKLKVTYPTGTMIWLDDQTKENPCRMYLTVQLYRVTDGVETSEEATVPIHGVPVISEKNYIFNGANYLYVIEDPDDYVTETIKIRYTIGEQDIYSESFDITIEPSIQVPTVSYGSVNYSDGNYYVHQLNSQFALNTRCELASETLIMGQDAVADVNFDKHNLHMAMNGTFITPSQMVTVKLTSKGGQEYTAVFKPSLSD